MDDQKKIDLTTLVAGAIEAEEQERYEILDAIKKSMSPEEAELFFELINVVKKGLIPPKKENKQ